jgi:enamine deaminase RidA (YjgF/YER057c/UK114 family)
MPIADVTIVGAIASEAPLAQHLANAIETALEAPLGSTWVRVHHLPASDYAESGETHNTIAPVFVELLRRTWPTDPDARAASLLAVCEAVATVTGRPRTSVHCLAEPPAAGRMAFGGERLVLAERARASSGARWESIVGYSRAVRVHDLVFVTGTTALTPDGGHAPDDDAYAQARQCIANLSRALAQLGASVNDVVRTRMFVTDIARDWEVIGRAHAEVFGTVRPATTMVEVKALIEPWMRVEIEADAVVG